jgi:hypothetical protein
MKNNRVKYVRMAILPLTKAKFYFAKYTNISRSMFTHWSKRRNEMKNNVNPNRDEVTAVCLKLHMRSLVICTADQTFRVFKSRRMRQVL